MKKRGLLSDPGFWLLVAVNCYLVWYYYQQPQVFTTLVWLYWAQSVTLGFFNFVDILTVRKTALSVDSMGKPSDSFTMKVPTALFFMVHYGFFHFGYMIFIFTFKRTGPFQLELFKYFFLAFFFGQIITFVQHKIDQKKHAANLGKMFFTPYLRIVPMHLTILLPAFLHISNLGLFLVLKSVADVLMYVVTKPAYKSRETDSALLASQQGMNM